ncbi:MAG: hypothetical protein ABIE74_03145 [Pseudomonadota bacterium]
MNYELKGCQKDFAEKAAKGFAVIKEAGEDLEALLVIRRELEGSHRNDPLLNNKGKAIIKYIIIVLAALYERDKNEIPLLLELLAFSLILDQDKEIKTIGEKLFQDYQNMQEAICFLRDKACAHRDRSIYGEVHGPKFDEIMNKPGLILHLLGFAEQSICAIKKIIEYRKQ